MPRKYIPERGDLVWLQFTPQAGREQAGHRPAVVLSPRNYNQKSSLALFCPVTGQVKGYPFEVRLPATVSIKGVALCDQIKSLDWAARRVELVARLPAETTHEILAKTRALLR
ncbi:MAG TPA: endoribonuclease MazF [Chthoniobacterales bacterium]|nr:endoribonuclease MazF [Chthoniobacterales bacterium]